MLNVSMIASAIKRIGYQSEHFRGFLESYTHELLENFLQTRFNCGINQAIQEPDYILKNIKFRTQEDTYFV